MDNVKIVFRILVNADEFDGVYMHYDHHADIGKSFKTEKAAINHIKKNQFGFVDGFKASSVSITATAYDDETDEKLGYNVYHMYDLDDNGNAIMNVDYVPEQDREDGWWDRDYDDDY